MPQGLALAGIARCDEADGDVASARSRYERALTMAREFGEPGLVATCLEGLARLTAASGDRSPAEQLLREASRVREAAVRPAPPHERRDLQDLTVHARPDPDPDPDS